MSITDETPLDLSQFTFGPGGKTSQPAEQLPTAVAVAELPAPDTRRLVDISKMPQEVVEQAARMAKVIDFSHGTSGADFIQSALSPLTSVSRELLGNTRVGDSGEVGRIAAAVIDGIKILRIEDLQKEASGEVVRPGGMLSRLFKAGGAAGSALKGFAENRKKFVSLLDAEEAKARRAIGDLGRTIELLDKQEDRVREAVGNLTLCIAACQVALERGNDHYEVLRQRALASENPGDAAVALSFRDRLTTFRASVQTMREGMVMTAELLPNVSLSRKDAEASRERLSTTLSITFPRLMALAALSAVQARSGAAGDQVERLDDAGRQMSLLLAKGTHDAAIRTASSMGGDVRNIETAKQVADMAIATMQEVLRIEQDVASKERERELQMVDVRDRLTRGMLGVQQQALATPVAS